MARRGDLVDHLDTRRALVLFATLALIGTAVELVMLRHWDSFEQVIPFGVVGVLLAVAWVIWRPKPTPRAVVLVLALACAASALGAWEHVESNHETAPLDANYGPKWESMSSVSQWWAAANGSVGPAPPLVPLAMTYAAGMLGVAAWVDRRRSTI